jgi:acyl-CoA reductase-like NAD-dependent aldehyde dehydrogenase
LLTIADTIEAHTRDLADICVLENGTPSSFADFVGAVTPADWFRYYAGWVDKLTGDVIPSYDADTLDYTLLEPHGVVGVFSAFNAPSAFFAMKLAPALAAGNTVVIKPSELAPYSTLRLGELVREAGLPPGVVNVITGAAASGQALAAHPSLDKLTFTGSARTASHILASAAANLTPTTLELGGKSASIIFADAELDGAIATSIQTGMFVCSGQACAAGTRLLVQREVLAEVTDTIIAISSPDLVGDPQDPGILMGPVISAAASERILGMVERAKSRGDGELLIGGSRLGGDLANGYYLPPTVFGDVDPESEIAQEEIFGPVMSIIPFDTEEEAVAIANGSRYGLAGYAYTGDLGRAHRVASAIDAGYVSINTFNPIPSNAPFGGVKGSGFGREGGYDGIKEMTRTKNVCVKLR